jgi:Flp pilus assembly protein CpaB
MRDGGAVRSRSVERGKGSVKKQTLILVLIGVILFVAGSAIAYASVEGAKKNTTSPTTAAPANVSAVVAKSNIPTGTTGQQMISENLVAIEPIAAKSYLATDLTSIQGLTDEVLSAPVQKGQAVTSAELTASTASISIPQNMDAMTVSISGAQDLAGYLQPGSHVDIYANISHLSTGGVSPVTGIPIPCTELAMSNIQVLDVSSTSPSLANTKGATGTTAAAAGSTPRTVPGSETLLLALQPGQARTLAFLSQNESISVVQPQQAGQSPPVGQCIGTDQTTTAP